MTDPDPLSEGTPAERAKRLLDAARTRGDVRRLAPRLDADPALRRAVWEEGNRRGAQLGEAAMQWPARRLLRVARAREQAARVRSNPVHRDESFVCGHCQGQVPAHGRTARNHCPWCLRSLHVDQVPGDRSSDCGALMDPIGVEIVGGKATLRHRCRDCGAEVRVRALQDGQVPDDWEMVIRLSIGEDV
ncbi:MAG: RNHCP domain-containing protein [Myxococcales bacterium]|nr:RNHCP domain-containing protein [Myxococcales bacterium]